MKTGKSRAASRPLPLVALVSFAWLLIGFLAAVQGRLFELYRRGDEAQTLLSWTLFQVPRWAPWALLTPAVYWLVKRFPIRSEHPLRGLAVHGIGCLGVILAHSALSAAFYQIAWPDTFGTQPFLQVLNLHASTWLVIASVVYWGMVGGWTVMEYHRRLQAEALAAARLQSQLATARLEGLEARLHPHFLFNTLQAISTLLLRDPQGARRMLRRLGDLLRTTLDDSRGHQIPLGEELRFVRAYLEIERVRFGDRLKVEWSVSPEAEEPRVPALLLQPLVENAIRHGISTRSGAGTLRIDARREGDDLRVVVEDRAAPMEPGQDGAERKGGHPAKSESWLQPSANGNGLGLRSVRERLEVLYGDRAGLELQPTDTGTRAVVRLPVERDPRATPP